ncbi:MAG TPA: MATE family efflux transporter [Acidobacteriota bacterium]|nr:MATE family efflux transporter [Acidobacteriota bacterium]
MTNTNNIVSGSIIGTVVSLAVPVVLGMFLEFALSVTDFYWVGRLGPVAQDAVTSSMVVIWTVFATSSIISIGITALVSRHVGAGDLDRASFYTRQGLILAALIYGAVTVVGYYCTPFVLAFMETGEQTFIMAVPYLRIFFLSTLFLGFAQTSYATFRAAGDTITPTVVGCIAVALNMVLDPLLIFGLGPLPALGVPGASLATAISMACAASLILWRLFGGKSGFRVDGILRTSPHPASLFKIARIGLPIASQHIVFGMVYWFLIRVVHRFGEHAGAAMGIGNRMESLSYLTCYGLSVAASTMVGQNLGAKNPDRAARCAWGASGLALGITLIITIVFVTLPRSIAAVFTDDPEVLKIAADYLIILGISQSAMAIEIVLEGAFSGAGDTIPPMVVMVPGAVARIPLAYYLAFNLGWGINGVWWTLTITSVVKALVFAYWFKLGRWKGKKI